jgi:hypothetical protein
MHANGPQDGSWLGRYRLLHRIGAGGMGVVHLALDARGRAVAVKAVHPHIVGDEQGRARLAREVTAMRRVVGPRVAEVLDADVDAETPYIVTRYVSGLPLDRLTEIDGPLTGADLWRLAHGLAEALATMHAAGVIHRDLKPGNVLIADGAPVVIDFGLAQVVDDARITRTGTMFGTPGYLAPELVEGRAVTAASDVHSWAATVAFAATGRPPYGSGPMDAVLHRVTRGEADLAGVPAPFDRLVRAGLAVDPAMRPTAAQILDALQAAEKRTETPTDALSPWARGGGTRVLSPIPTQVPAPTLVRAPTPAPVATPVPPVPAVPAEHVEQRGTRLVVLALSLLFVALASVAPAAAAIGYAAGLVAVRCTEHVAAARWRRRSLHGVRRSDLAVSAATLPWHLVRAALGAGLQLLFAAAAVAVVVAAAWASGSETALDQPEVRPVLAAAGAVAVVVSWWGPGARAARRGAVRLVRGTLPVGWVRLATAGVLVMVSALLATAAVLPTAWPVA